MTHSTGATPARGAVNTALELPEPKGATPLTLEEKLGLKDKHKHITTRGELNELESANIIEGLKWLEQRPKSFDVLTDTVARTMHKRLYEAVWDWAGKYRQTEKNIGVPVWDISTKLRTCLDDARYWRDNNTYEPLEAAARFHHELVRVHPFPNGNGRWARIMADIYLTGFNKVFILDWSGGNTFSAHRTTYIAALKAADGHDFEALINFVKSLPRLDFET